MFLSLFRVLGFLRYFFCATTCALKPQLRLTDRLEETAQALHECLYDIIARGNFTQEDFEEVRYPAASKILSAMMTNSFWGSSVRSLQLTEIYGKNIRHIQEIPTFFQGITFEEIQVVLYSLLSIPNRGSSCLLCRA